MQRYDNVSPSSEIIIGFFNSRENQVYANLFINREGSTITYYTEHGGYINLNGITEFYLAVR